MTDFNPFDNMAGKAVKTGETAKTGENGEVVKSTKNGEKAVNGVTGASALDGTLAGDLQNPTIPKRSDRHRRARKRWNNKEKSHSAEKTLNPENTDFTSASFNPLDTPKNGNKAISENAVKTGSKSKRGFKAHFANFKKSVKKGEKTALIVALAILFPVIAVLASFGIKSVYDYYNISVPVAQDTINLDSLKESTTACDPFLAKHLKCSIATIVSDDYGSGRLISQSAKPGSTVKRGSEVKLLYSLGADKVTMPTIAGMELMEAEKLLKDLGLSVETEIEEVSDFEKDVVIGADKEPGEIVSNGDTILLKVASGKFKVPNFVGKTEDLAKKELADSKLGLNVSFEEETTDGAPGLVIKQSLEADSESETRDLVLTVSRAKEVKELIVPKVEGSKLADAQIRLANLGFSKVQSVEVESKTGEKGDVIKVSPKPGSKTPNNETIFLVVAK